jgi:hypothetical protein
MAFLIVVLLLVSVIYGLIASLVATIARNRGRDPYLWVLLALLISPLAALVLLALLPPADGPAGRPPGAAA